MYVVFGSSVIAALDYKGELVWRKEITPHRFDVALGASPVLFEDTVVVQCDAKKDPFSATFSAVRPIPYAMP